MGDISAHFSAKEFRCKCHDCQSKRIKPVINMTLITVLEMIHAYFAEHFNTQISIVINSAHRCQTHNAAIKGAPSSRHITGEAADIVVRALTEGHQWQEIDTRLVYDLIDSHFTQNFGCHAYPTFTHVDVRPIRSRW